MSGRKQAQADRLRDQLLVGLDLEQLAGLPGDPIDLPDRDIKLFGDLRLEQSLPGEVDDLDLPLSQFWHMGIESTAVRNFNVHL